MTMKNAGNNNTTTSSSSSTITHTSTSTPLTTTTARRSSSLSNKTTTPTTTSSSSMSKPQRLLGWIFSLGIVMLALESLQVLRGFSTVMTTTATSPTLVRRAEEGILSDLLTVALSSLSFLNDTTATTSNSTSSGTSSVSSQGAATATAVISVAATLPRKTLIKSTITTTTASNVVVPSVFQEGQSFMDALCVGCREQTVKTGKLAKQSCGSLIYKQLQQQRRSAGNKNKSYLVEATQTVLALLHSSKQQNDECHLCRPDACLDNDFYKHYWRPDTVAPRVVHAKTLYLPGIPALHRVPNPNLVNWTLYFSNTSHVHPHRTYYFEYNPSIVQIPKGQIPTHVLTPEQAADVVYLASFRVTNTQQCVFGDDELMMIGGQWPRPPSQDYLGLALLRHDLSIIVDVVLDNKKRSFRRQQNRNHALHGMEDYRLFVLNEQIYVASFNEIVPLWLVVPPPTTATNANNNNNNDNVVLVENKFPSVLTVHARTFASCAGSSGKNINYFVDHTKSGKVTVVAELYPMLTKMAIHVDQPCPSLDTKQAQAKAAAQKEEQLLHHNATLPIHKSFGSYEEIHFFNHGAFGTMSGERGSACCVQIPNPTTTSTTSSSTSDTTNSSNYLLLGISHSKTKFKNKATRDNLPGNVSANHFFSAFYAMDPHEPYTVRARSGRFCLGFSSVNETAITGDNNDNENDKNPFARSNMVQLRLGSDHYDCPRIHFVSGMVEKANDASRIIIAYGIQDCAPRFIEVEKHQILQMLFPDLYRQHQNRNDNDKNNNKPLSQQDNAQASTR